MILLIFLATILIIGVTIYQYNKQTVDYNVSRFGRKEETLKKELDIQLYQRSNIAWAGFYMIILTFFVKKDILPP